MWKGFQSIAEGFGSLLDIMGTGSGFRSKTLARLKRSRERGDLEDELAIAQDYLVTLADVRSTCEEGTPGREILNRKIRAKQDEIQKIKERLNEKR